MRTAIRRLARATAALGLAALPLAGQPGPGLFGDRHWRRPVEAVGDLPVSASWGTVQLVSGELYWYDGTAWAVIAGADGPAGPTGPQGEPGPTGAQGAPGAAGLQGATGSVGSDGTPGSTGAQGPQGIAGATGGTGAQGPQGETGAVGATGPTGTAATIAAGTATTVAPGSSAAVSNSGTSSAAVFDFTIPRGDTGATGATGAIGSTGPTGAAGADGIPRTIQEEGVDLTQRLKVNFSGASITCADNAGASRTDCTVTDDDIPEAGDFGALALTGPVTSSGLATTIAGDAVALGSQTTGPYVSSATASQGLTVTGTEGASVGLQDCAALELLQRNAGDTAWACATLGDTATSVLLAGRPTGQTVNGGTGGGEALILKSTGSATKGQVKIGDGTTFPVIFQQLAADTTKTQILINRVTAVDSEVVHISGAGDGSPEILIRDASSGATGPLVKIDRTAVPSAANQSVGSMKYCGANACYNEAGFKSTAAWSGAGPSYFWIGAGDAAGNVANVVFRAANVEAGGTQVVAGGALSTLASVGGTLNTGTTQVGNTAGTETDLYSFSVPASTLLTNGNALHLDCGGTFAASVNTDKRIRVKFGATTIYDSGALAITSASAWKVQADVLRTGAATQKGTAGFQSSSSVLASSAGYSTAAETLSGAVTIKITGQGTGASDVVGEWCKLSWMP